GGVALHLVERHFLNVAVLLHRVAEALCARLAVVAREGDRHQAYRALVPMMLLERGGERHAGIMGALLVVGDDEGYIVPGHGADIRDHHRDVRLLGEAQDARSGGGIGRRNEDTIDMSRYGVLSVL